MTADELDRCMRKFYKCVYSMALCYCKNPSDADDIAQDVFLKLFTYGGSFESDEQLKAWLLRCAVNRSINIIRSGFRRFSRPLEEAENIGRPDSYPEEGNTLLPLIMKLSRNNRTALYLYYYEHFTIEEISEITGVSASAVRSRLARGRKQLKRLIDSERNGLYGLRENI